MGSVEAETDSRDVYLLAYIHLNYNKSLPMIQIVEVQMLSNPAGQ